MRNKPKHLLIFKILGILGAIATVAGIVLVIIGFGDFESNHFLIGSFVAPIGLFAAVLGITIGFSPEIAKARAKTMRYIQEENKEELAAIASTHAEIMRDAVATTAGAVADGMRETKFCKHCGTKIDGDAKYCPACGKAQ